MRIGQETTYPFVLAIRSCLEHQGNLDHLVSLGHLKYVHTCIIDDHKLDLQDDLPGRPAAPLEPGRPKHPIVRRHLCESER